MIREGTRLYRLPEESLTEREVEILALVQRNMSYREVGACLGYSRNTIRTYVSRVLGKLGVHSRREAIEFVEGIGR